MKIKAVDVARKLNISKATVSLALNDKPGVSQQTKEAVLRCIEGNGAGGRRAVRAVPIFRNKKIYAANIGTVFNGAETDD